MDFVLLVFRVLVGGLLVGHGAQKLLGWFDGPGLEGATAMFEKMGYRPPRIAAMAAAVTECTGGLLLFLGLLTPLAGAMIVGAMGNAIAVHRGNGVWAATGGYELPLVYAGAAVAIVATGPGVIAVDAIYGMSLWGGFWAILAVVVGAGTGALVRKSRGSLVEGGVAREGRDRGQSSSLAA